MSDLKKKKGCFFKFFFINISILLIVFIITLTIYFFTKRNPQEFIPREFSLYLRIPSIARLYNKLVNSKVPNVLASEKNFYEIYKIVYNFRENSLLKNALFFSLAKTNAHVVLDNNNQFFIILDLGFRSIPLNVALFVIKHIKKLSNFSIYPVKNDKNDFTYFKLYTKEQIKPYYFYTYNNIFVFSFNVYELENTFEDFRNKSNLKYEKSLLDINKKSKREGVVEIYLNSEKIVAILANYNNVMKRSLELFSFNSTSLVSVNIEKDYVSLKSFSEFLTKDKIMSSLLDYSAGPSQMAINVIDDTSFFVSLKFKSFKDLYETFLYLNKEDSKKNFKKIEAASRMLFDLTIDELIFNWLGNEVGLLTLKGYNSPLLMLEIKNRKKLEFVFKRLHQSIFFEKEEKISFANYEINKLKFPDFVETILYYFTKNVPDTPYYVIVDNFLILCNESSPIIDFLTKYDNAEFLVKNPSFFKVYKKTELNSNVFLYLDYKERETELFDNAPLLKRLIKQYNRAIMTLKYDKRDLKTTAVFGE